VCFYRVDVRAGRRQCVSNVDVQRSGVDAVRRLHYTEVTYALSSGYVSTFVMLTPFSVFVGFGFGFVHKCTAARLVSDHHGAVA